MLNICISIMYVYIYIYIYDPSARPQTVFLIPGRGIMEEESWRRNHGGEIMEEESWKRNDGGVVK